MAVARLLIEFCLAWGAAMGLGLVAATLAGMADTIVAMALLWVLVPWQCRRYLRLHRRHPTRAQRRAALLGMTAIVVGTNTGFTLMLLPSSPFPAQDLAARSLLLGSAWLALPMYAALLWLLLRSVWGSAPRPVAAARPGREAALVVPLGKPAPAHAEPLQATSG